MNRREFLKTTTLGLGAIALGPRLKLFSQETEWPTNTLLGRNCVGGRIEVRKRPSSESDSVKTLYEDAVVPWLREVIGDAPGGRLSRRWVETQDGYIYAPNLQPVKNLPNKPIEVLPQTEIGTGFWAEVSVPYVDIFPDKLPSSNWLRESIRPRLYYSQIVWIDDVSTNANGEILYHAGEKIRVDGKMMDYPDTYWGKADAFRPLTDDDLSPIHPSAPDKRIIVNLNHQTLTAYEGQQEVYFCRVSTGARFNAAGEAVEKWSTPIGPHPIWRKSISFHMQGGSVESGWDTPGVSWTSLFVGEGVAIHSTFWHNDFGTPRSHGCVNTTPEDAKWIFRWTEPNIPYLVGDLTIPMPGGTIVEVIEG